MPALNIFFRLDDNHCVSSPDLCLTGWEYAGRVRRGIWIQHNFNVLIYLYKPPKTISWHFADEYPPQWSIHIHKISLIIEACHKSFPFHNGDYVLWSCRWDIRIGNERLCIFLPRTILKTVYHVLFRFGLTLHKISFIRINTIITIKIRIPFVTLGSYLRESL